MSIRRGNEEEWRAYGREFKRLRDQLQELLIKHQGLLPAKVMDIHFKIVRDMDRFRSMAEDEMMKRGGPLDRNVWYPTKRQRSYYTEEVKAAAIERVKKAESLSRAARELNIPKTTLFYWVKFESKSNGPDRAKTGV